MHTIAQKNSNIPLLQLLGDVTLAILDKYCNVLDKIWLKQPIRWNSSLHRIKARQSLTEVIPWMIIQFMHGLVTVYYILLITGYGGTPVEELKSWLKIFIAFVSILDVALLAVSYTLWSKRDLLGACINAVTQLPTRTYAIPSQFEVPPEDRLANKKAVILISHLVSSSLTLQLVLSPYAMAIVMILSDLDPIHYFFRLFSILEAYHLYKVVLAFTVTVTVCNRFFCTITYIFLLIMIASRVLLVQLTILQPPKTELTPTIGHRSFIGTFNIKLVVYRRLYLILKYCNEMGGVTHSLLMTMAFFTKVISGSVVVLRTSFLSNIIPSYIFPLFPMYFLFILGLFFASVPIAANMYENSLWFKYSWMKVGGYERKYVRKQLVSCVAIKAKLGVMGFVDRSYIMTYLDALLNNIVNVVMYVSETRLQVGI
ncbi:unnamed protein product [Orchesella dallaii]|uniref:Odorant receptor n=1 Tax=Orchesella dallaii TaxID=48710 RepID=A0ABP1Q1G8_9HEXA